MLIKERNNATEDIKPNITFLNEILYVTAKHITECW